MNANKLWLTQVLSIFMTVLPCKVDAAEKMWGVAIHLGGGLSNAATVGPALRELGVNSFRDEIYWRNIERVKGTFQLPRGLSDLDTLFTSSASMGLRPIAILDYGNPLYFDGLPKSDADREAFARYASFVLRRHGKNVAAFELWNEWNIGLGSNPRVKGSAADYVKLLKRIRPVIDADAPGIPLVVGAVANRDMAWIREFGALGGFALCNGFSVHPYNFTARDASAEEVAGWIDSLDQEIRSKAGKALPIYVTEIGWPTHTGVGASTETLSAQRLLKTALLLASKDSVRGVWWYDLFDDGADATEKEHRFGLIRPDGSRKPSFDAYKLFLSHFKTAAFTQNRSAGSNVALEFRAADGRRLIAVWSSKGTAHLQITGQWQLLPVAAAEDSRIRNELTVNKAARLGDWPLLLVLGNDAQIQFTQAPPGAPAIMKLDQKAHYRRAVHSTPYFAQSDGAGFE